MFDKLSNLEWFYLGCAGVGGGLFILRSIMMIVGMGGDDHHDGDAGAHDDCGADAHHDGEGSPAHDFRMVSLHSLTAFTLLFGLTGFLMTHNNAAAEKQPWFASPWFAGAVAAAVGLVTMFIIAKIFQGSRKLQSDGTIYPRHAAGAEGSVYLAIRPGEIGKVQITVRGALKVFDARANDPAATLKTGDPVKVVATGDVMVVEKG